MNLNGTLALALFGLGMYFLLTQNPASILCFLLGMNFHLHYRIDKIEDAVLKSEGVRRED
jgi:hypothetical protein